MLLAQKHPEWKMDNELKDKVGGIATPKIRAIVLGYHTPPQNKTGKPPKLHYDVSREPDSEEGVRSQINKDLVAFQRTLNDTGFLPREIMLRSVAIGLANSDHKYLVNRDGRFRIADPDKKATFFEDKYLSLVCYFVLEGNPMGLADYDEMFRELVPFLTEPLRGKLVDKNQFKGVVDIYSSLNDKIASVNTNEISLLSKERKEIAAEWDSSNVKVGKY